MVNAGLRRPFKFERCGGRNFKILGLLVFPTNKGRGITMTTQTMRARYPNSERAEKLHDLLLVSSFGLWAVLLGFSPVLAFHMLMAS